MSSNQKKNIKVSIIISNRNDLVMLNITLNSAIEALKSIDMQGEIVLVDNSDQRFSELLPVVCPTGFVKRYNLRIHKLAEPSFTAARMIAAEKSQGDYIFCVDSHVLFGLNTLKDSLSFMEHHKGNKQLGFGHPPIRWAHQGPAAVKHTLTLAPNGTPWGQWGPGITKEQTIFWKFMPWICRRDWYLNTLKGYGSHSTHSLSWGGAEMLQQIKSWMLGFEQWGIITDPIVHIGPYTPEVVKTGQYKYRVYGNSGHGPHGLGVLVAFAVLGGPDVGFQHAKLCEDRIKHRHGISVEEKWPEVMNLARDEHLWLMEHKKYDYLELLEKKPWNKNVLT